MSGEISDLRRTGSAIKTFLMNLKANKTDWNN